MLCMRIRILGRTFMKKTFLQLPIFRITLGLCLVPVASTFAAEISGEPNPVINGSATAEVSTPAVTAQVSGPAVSAQIGAPVLRTAPGVPAGVRDVVKLTRAQVSDEVIISYINNSASTSSLSPDEIVRLRSEGVSDRVINAMLDQHTRAVQAFQAGTAAAAAAQSYAPEAGQSDPNYTQAPAQSAPVSTSYVIPYPQATAAYYGYGYSPYYYSPYYSYPYYYGPGSYGYYGGPAISFRFGFGGRGGHFGGGHFGGHNGHR